MLFGNKVKKKRLYNLNFYIKNKTQETTFKNKSPTMIFMNTDEFWALS